MTDLHKVIAEAFLAEKNPVLKANMISTMPIELLAVGTEVFQSFGSSPEVWLAYLKRVGPRGISQLSAKELHDRIQPLLYYDRSQHTINCLLKAGIYVEKSLDILANKFITSPTGFKPDEYYQTLKSLGEQALPVIVQILKNENPYYQQYAFLAIDIDTWQDEKALKQLSKAVLSVLSKSQDDFITQHSLLILAKTDPEGAMRVIIRTISEWDLSNRWNHPLKESSNEVRMVFEAVKRKKLLQQFAIASIARGAMWTGGFDRFELLLIVAKMDEENLELALREASQTQMTLERCGEDIASASAKDHPSNDVKLVISKITGLVTSLLGEGQEIGWLLPLLAKAKYSLPEAFLIEATVALEKEGKLGPGAYSLTDSHRFPDSTPLKMMEYLDRLSASGRAKVDLAHAILIRLRNEGYLYPTVLNSALDTIVATRFEGQTISGFCLQEMLLVPVTLWEKQLESLLRLETNLHLTAPFVELAVKEWGLKRPLVSFAVARLMTSEHEDVKRIVAGILAEAEK